MQKFEMVYVFATIENEYLNYPDYVKVQITDEQIARICKAQAAIRDNDAVSMRILWDLDGIQPLRYNDNEDMYDTVTWADFNKNLRVKLNSCTLIVTTYGFYFWLWDWHSEAWCYTDQLSLEDVC